MDEINPQQKLVASWKSPSNIALVKYWGKKESGTQIPANASVSLTLDKCHSQTQLTLVPTNSTPKIDVVVSGKAAPSFQPKIVQWVHRLLPDFPELNNYDLHIQTQNTFPHGSGIASSASGFSALACCLFDIYQTHFSPVAVNPNLRSSWARLGSGSACRSVIPHAGLWGQHPQLSNSSDEYAVPITLNEVFNSYQDTILLVDKGEKKVSSTAGHGLLKTHPFAKARYELAQNNIEQMLEILKSGDIEAFIKLTESEALILHALMMSGNPYYLLVRPNTIAVIEKVMEIREQTKIPWCFTLDAGANVHLLYPKAYTQQAKEMIDRELVGFCENGQYICDHVGLGPQSI